MTAQLLWLLAALAYMALPRFVFAWLRRSDRLAVEAFIEQCREAERLQREHDARNAE